jgi:hypothetical protein
MMYPAQFIEGRIGCGEGGCDDGLAHVVVFFSFDCAG